MLRKTLTASCSSAYGGEHLKHLVYARGAPIACLAWSSAPRHLCPRDRFIGWTPEERRAGIHLLAQHFWQYSLKQLKSFRGLWAKQGTSVAPLADVPS
jgi:Domain of unknown function (DUF4338)